MSDITVPDVVDWVCKNRPRVWIPRLNDPALSDPICDNPLFPLILRLVAAGQSDQKLLDFWNRHYHRKVFKLLDLNHNCKLNNKNHIVLNYEFGKLGFIYAPSSELWDAGSKYTLIKPTWLSTIRIIENTAVRNKTGISYITSHLNIFSIDDKLYSTTIKYYHADADNLNDLNFTDDTPLLLSSVSATTFYALIDKVEKTKIGATQLFTLFTTQKLECAKSVISVCMFDTMAETLGKSVTDLYADMIAFQLDYKQNDILAALDASSVLGLSIESALTMLAGSDLVVNEHALPTLDATI